MSLLRSIVTGAANGIGKACAISLAQKGNKVAIIDNNEQDVEILMKEFTSTNNGEIIPYIGDFSQEKTIHEFFDFTMNKLNGIDLLLNNVAISKKKKNG